MDLDIQDCFGMKKTLSYDQRNMVGLLHASNHGLDQSALNSAGTFV